MEKYIIKGLNAIEIGHFKSYVAADKVLASGKTPTDADKREIILTVENVCRKLEREGITKDEVKAIIEELQTHPRAASLQRKDRIIEMLQTVVEGFPVQKTYAQWEVLSEDPTLSKDARITIKGSLIDFLQYFNHLENTFGKAKLAALDIGNETVTVFLKQDDITFIENTKK